VTGISKPTIYKMFTDGRLRYVQIGPRFRRIPATELPRLGLASYEA
jgi:excisionase family DNA binding protein